MASVIAGMGAASASLQVSEKPAYDSAVGEFLRNSHRGGVEDRACVTNEIAGANAASASLQVSEKPGYGYCGFVEMLLIEHQQVVRQNT